MEQFNFKKTNKKLFDFQTRETDSDWIVTIDNTLTTVVVLTTTGNIVTFGNFSAALGRKETEGNNTYIPKDIQFNHKIISISCGSDHVLSLDVNLLLYSWGNNDKGQLGIGKKYKHRIEPDLVYSLDNIMIKSIHSGNKISFAITKNANNLYAWGNNYSCDLGISNDNSYEVIYKPKLVSIMSRELREYILLVSKYHNPYCIIFNRENSLLYKQIITYYNKKLKNIEEEKSYLTILLSNQLSTLNSNSAFNVKDLIKHPAQVISKIDNIRNLGLSEKTEEFSEISNSVIKQLEDYMNNKEKITNVTSLKNFIYNLSLRFFPVQQEAKKLLSDSDEAITKGVESMLKESDKQIKNIASVNEKYFKESSGLDYLSKLITKDDCSQEIKFTYAIMSKSQLLLANITDTLRSNLILSEKISFYTKNALRYNISKCNSD